MFEHLTRGTQLMAIYTPYTYYIGWTNLSFWYYGSRYAKESKCIYETGCHPDDFWNTYFTSSEVVEKFIEEHGHPDVIKIDKTFQTEEDAREYEHQVLKFLCAAENSMWLNKSTGKSPPGGPLSENHKQKISNTLMGVKKSETHRQNIIKSLTGRPHKPASEQRKQKLSKAMRGRKISDEQKERLREINTGKTHSEETKIKIGNSKRGTKHSEETKKLIGSKNLGRLHSEEAKKKISDRHKGIPQTLCECPYCGKMGGFSVMKRWHFDNCKMR
jgi:hypothetical protein